MNLFQRLFRRRAKQENKALAWKDEIDEICSLNTDQKFLDFDYMTRHKMLHDSHERMTFDNEKEYNETMEFNRKCVKITPLSEFRLKIEQKDNNARNR